MRLRSRKVRHRNPINPRAKPFVRVFDSGIYVEKEYETRVMGPPTSLLVVPNARPVLRQKK